MDGLRGPLILHNVNETYKYDEDVIVTVSGKYCTRLISLMYLAPNEDPSPLLRLVPSTKL
jgi:hypothetical protein